jgi:isocitrate lyase
MSLSTAPCAKGRSGTSTVCGRRRLTREQQIAQLEKDWAENPRWKGIKRGYSAADVVRLRGSLQIEHTLAKRGAEKLWT